MQLVRLWLHLTLGANTVIKCRHTHADGQTDGRTNAQTGRWADILRTDKHKTYIRPVQNTSVILHTVIIYTHTIR